MTTLILFGLLCGIISSILGAGSSMIMAPLLIYVFPLITGKHFSLETITSATLLLTLFSTLAASIRYHKAKLIPYRYALVFALSGSIGSFISGSYISKYINHLFILILFGSIAVLSLIFNLIPIRENKNPVLTKKPFLVGAFIIFLLGLMTGIIGIGGMVLFMPYMVNVLYFSTRKTIGATTFIGLMIALFGSLGKFITGTIEWDVSLFVAIGGMIGGLMGPTLSRFFPDIVLRYGMNIILISIIITILVDVSKII